MFSNWKWMLLAAILFVATFGPVVIVSLLVLIFSCLGVALYEGHLAMGDLTEMLEYRTSPPPHGIPVIISTMEKTVKVKNIDKRMTGAAAMDSVLHEVLEYTMRDYIMTWYRPLSDHDDFPVSVWECAQKLLISFSTRIKQIDWLPYFTNQLVDDFASHIRLYRRAHDRITFIKDGEKTVEAAFFDYEVQMENNMCRDEICIDVSAEKQYLQDLSEVLLFLLLPPEDFKNKVFRFILREVLVNGVFKPMIDLFSDPDYINQNISWMCKEGTLTNETFINVLKTTVHLDELTAVCELVDREIYRWRSKDIGGDDDMVIKQTLNSLYFVKTTCEVRSQRLRGTITDADQQGNLLGNQSFIIMSVDDIISNNIAVQAFIEFLAMSGLQQYLFFYLNVDGYRTLAEQQRKEERVTNSQQKYRDSLRQAATILFDQYLSDKATCRIKVDDNALRRVSQCIRKKDLTDSVFDEVQAEVYVRLHGENFYEAFLQSSQYAKLLGDMDLVDDGDSLSMDSDSVCDKPCIGDLTTITHSDDCMKHPASISAQIIKAEVVGEDNKLYGLFSISVKLTYPDAADETWASLRRYSDFSDLHSIIFETYGGIAGLILPGKTAFRNLNSAFLEKRRKALNAYLQALLNAEILYSREGLLELVLKFLSPSVWERQKSHLAQKVDALVNPLRSSIRHVSGIVRHTTETGSDPFSSFTQLFKLKNKLPRPESGKVGAGLDPEDGENIPLRIMLLLMDEVFDLHNKNQWFRRRIIAILRQIIKATYGDKINRKIVEEVDNLTSAEQMAEYVKAFRDAFWPCGLLAEPRAKRDPETLMRTRVICKAKMLGLIPDQLRHLLGNDTIQKGVYRIFHMLQVEPLNRRLIYVVLEGMLQSMFPDNKFNEIFSKMHSRSQRARQVSFQDTLKFNKCSAV